MAKIIKLKNTNIGASGPTDDVYPVTTTSAVYGKMDGDNLSLDKALNTIIQESRKPEFKTILMKRAGNANVEIPNNSWIDCTTEIPSLYGIYSSVKVKGFGDNEGLDLTFYKGFRIRVNASSTTGTDPNNDKTAVTSINHTLPFDRNVPITVTFTYNKQDDINSGVETSAVTTMVNFGVQSYCNFGKDENITINDLNSNLSAYFLIPGTKTINIKGNNTDSFKYIYFAVPNYFDTPKITQPDGMGMELKITEVKSENKTFGDRFNSGTATYTIYKSVTKINTKLDKKLTITLKLK